MLLMLSDPSADLGNPLLLGGDCPVLSSQIHQTIIGMCDAPKGASLAVLLLVPTMLMFFAHKAGPFFDPGVSFCVLTPVTDVSAGRRRAV